MLISSNPTSEIRKSSLPGAPGAVDVVMVSTS
jgi:hypothetical protein